MKVVIIRGVPGSGKSTYIDKHFSNAVVCSADHYFMKNGIYQYDPSKIGEAHKHCMKKFLTATYDLAEWGKDTLGGFAALVVVDNTNIRWADFSPYVLVGQARGYEIEVVRMATDSMIASQRNVHGVPEEKVIAMTWGMEKCPPYLNEKVVS